jgi:transcriptional regulator with GAF, ATPase, and Fis domain
MKRSGQGMAADSHLVLELWRRLAAASTLVEGVERALPVLAERLPLVALVVRRLELAGPSLETLAAASCAGSPLTRPHSVLGPDSLRDLAAAGGDRVARAVRQGAADDPFAVAVPDGAEGEAMVGPLWGPDRLLGVVVLLAGRKGHFRPAHREIATELLEPLAAALAAHCRVHDITTECEAARADRHTLLTKLGRRQIDDGLVGGDSGLREVMAQVDQVSQSDVPVLIFGETGSGKEVIARAIHNRSRRAAGPFLRVNCGAIPSELVDSELFGHERGSFTGAVHQRKGWFERADGGTLLLDEVAELSPAAQVRLLRVLQDGSFERVGGQHSLRVDVRIVAATHRDLFGMVSSGQFREDLWYRLAVFPIELPALRERPEDMPALATHLALRASRRFGLSPILPTRADIDLLTGYPWPGNVRELAAVIDRAAILGNGERLHVAQALGVGRTASMPAGGPKPAVAQTGPEVLASLDEAMATHIERALSLAGGRIEGLRGAARLLRVNPHTLRSRMRRLGIDWRAFRSP